MSLRRQPKKNDDTCFRGVLAPSSLSGGGSSTSAAIGYANPSAFATDGGGVRGSIAELYQTSAVPQRSPPHTVGMFASAFSQISLLNADGTSKSTTHSTNDLRRLRGNKLRDIQGNTLRGEEGQREAFNKVERVIDRCAEKIGNLDVRSSLSANKFAKFDEQSTDRETVAGSGQPYYLNIWERIAATADAASETWGTQYASAAAGMQVFGKAGYDTHTKLLGLGNCALQTTFENDEIGYYRVVYELTQYGHANDLDPSEIGLYKRMTSRQMLNIEKALANGTIHESWTDEEQTESVFTVRLYDVTKTVHTELKGDMTQTRNESSFFEITVGRNEYNVAVYENKRLQMKSELTKTPAELIERFYVNATDLKDVEKSKMRTFWKTDLGLCPFRVERWRK